MQDPHIPSVKHALMQLHGISKPPSFDDVPWQQPYVLDQLKYIWGLKVFCQCRVFTCILGEFPSNASPLLFQEK